MTGFSSRDLDDQKLKGWVRHAFEHALRLPPECCLMESGHYTNPLTHDLFVAFKAGLAITPTRGQFVIAELRSGTPHFPNPAIYPFKDLARDAQRDHSHSTGAVCAIFQQVSVYDPAWVR
jgi:hypothetical protein